MASTQSFYVSTKDNKLRITTAPFREYFIKRGRKEGQAKYIIEVFGYQHVKVAKDIKEMVQKAGMQNDLFVIRVETR